MESNLQQDDDDYYWEPNTSPDIDVPLNADAPSSPVHEPMEIDDFAYEHPIQPEQLPFTGLFDAQLPASLLDNLMNTDRPTPTADSPELIDMREYHIEEEHIQCSLDLYAMAVEAGVPRETWNAMIKRINSFTNGVRPKLYSYQRAQNELRRRYPVKPQLYDVCPDGCKMFENDDTTDVCEFCGKHQFKDETTTPVKQVLQLPLKQQLALLIKDRESREMLMHRSTREASELVLKDVFDGDAYKEMENVLFTGAMDIALGLYTDDFTRYRRGGQSMTIVHLVVLNLPPEIRYEDKYMLQVCVTPGPNKPQDLFSFLKPFMDDLEVLCRRGITVQTEEGDFTAKAHLFLQVVISLQYPRWQVTRVIVITIVVGFVQ